MTKLTPRSARKFILDNTALMAPPHVPEVLLHLADEAHDLWLRTEEELAEIGLPPPFWAFAWAGGQASPAMCSIIRGPYAANGCSISPPVPASSRSQR